MTTPDPNAATTPVATSATPAATTAALTATPATPAATAVPAAMTTPATASSCFRPNCPHPVFFEFTWPGKPRVFACEADASNILQIAGRQDPPLTKEQIGMRRVGPMPAGAVQDQPKIVRVATINVTERGQALLQALIAHVEQTAEQMKTMGDGNPQAKAGRQFAELVGSIFKAVSIGPTPCTLDEQDGVPLITTA